MTWLKKLIQLLNKPFPEDESRAEFFRNLVFIGLFVAFFLFTFEPFGFQNTNFIKIIVAVSYGVVTFITGSLFYLTIGALFRTYVIKQNLTLGKWLVQMVAIVLTISLANFIFSRILAGSMEWKWFPQMLVATFSIGIFPVTVLATFAMLRQEKRYQNIAAEINEKHPQKVSIKQSSIAQTIFDIEVTRIRYIEALQNYAKIIYLDEQNELKEQVERTTLKSILKKVEGNSIVRCHRSFLVNQDIILSTSGNAQGLLLSLAGTDKKVPVSRSYVRLFRGT